MIRVLFVDEEPAFLSFGKNHLEMKAGFSVDTARSGTEAVSLLKKQSYDAIISDYAIRDIDGISFLKGIRAFYPHIPFIFFTRHDVESVAIEALNSGADFYLKREENVTAQLTEITQIIEIMVSRVRAELELRRSEETFRIITEYSHEWLYWIDQDGVLRYISPSCKQITGYSRGEFHRNPELIHEIVLDSDRYLWSDHQKLCGIDKGPLLLTFRIRHKNGGIRWIDHACQPIFYSDGGFAGIRVSNRDISAQKLAEETLSRERNNFLKIFSAAPVGLLLINHEIEIIQANAAISAMVLRDPADIIRKRGGGGLGCIHSLEDPRGCGYSGSCPNCPLRNGIEAVLAKGVSIQEEIIPLRLMIGGKSQLRWLSINAEPVEIEGDEYVIVAIDDITEKRNTEIALLENEEKFRTLSDSTTAAILMFREDRWIHVNPAAEEISGYSREELLSMTFWEVIHPAFRDHLIQDGLARERGEKALPRHSEIKIIRKDGRERWIDMVASTVIIGQKPAGLVTAIDITERKNVEEKLSESEEKYRIIFENQIDLYYQTDMDGVILNLSPSCYKLTGFHPDDLIGTHVLNLYVNPEERQRLLDTLYSTGIVYDFEVLLKNKAGVHTPVSINCHTIRDKEGNLCGIEGTIRDISERKQIEQKMYDLIAQHQTILENVPAFIWYKDRQNMFIRINPAAAQVFGKKVSDIEGKTFPEIFPGAKDLYYSDDIEIIRTGRPRFGIVEEIKTLQGDRIWVQTDKVPVRNNEGEIIGILIVSTDITERKKVKDAITLANKKLNLLSSITRHDIVNQLQALYFSLELIKKADLDHENREFLDKAVTYASNIERQIAFTQDYQDIGIHSPLWQLVPDVIRGALKNLVLGSILLDISLPEVQVFADPLLEKVFHNLIDNAIRYGQKITTIQVFGYESQGRYVIVCSDDGIGIPERYKEGIFRREYYKHTGFGLNLSREILEITGIQISETGKEGSGARFEMAVPKGGYRLP